MAYQVVKKFDDKFKRFDTTGLLECFRSRRMSCRVSSPWSLNDAQSGLTKLIKWFSDNKL